MTSEHLKFALILIVTIDLVLARRGSAEAATPWPTLGMVGRYETPATNGDRLVIKPILDSDPLRVWILKATKSGDGFRYLLGY